MLTLTVLVGGALATGSWWVGIALGVASLLAERLSHRWVPGLYALAVLGVGAGLAMGAPIDQALPVLLVMLLLHFRTLDPQPALATLVAGLLLVVAAVHSSSAWFLLALGAWVAHLVREPGRRALLGPILAVSAVLFALLPRFGTFESARLDALTGFDDDVELGDLSDLMDDPTRVFTARFSRPPTEPVYFRGIALDQFDGKRWSTQGNRIREPDWDGGLPDTVRVDVELDATNDGVLFVPGTVDGIDTDGLAVERDPAGAYHLPGPARSVRYTAYVRPPYGPGRGDPFQDAEPRTDLPESIGPQLRELFRQRAGEGDANARMQALSTWLRSDFAYTRAPRDADPEAPLDHFLTTEKAGHCEYFASALAVGGRALGIPTRVVNGFVGGEPAGDGALVLRRYHAHSWVEYFDGDRWVLADATPETGAPAGPGAMQKGSELAQDVWDGLLDYDGRAQVDTAVGMGRTLAPRADRPTAALLGAAVIGGVLGTALLVFRRRRERPEAPPPRSAIEEAVHRVLGPPARPGLSPLEQAELLGRNHPEVAEDLRTLVWMAYRQRYGDGQGDPRAANTLADRIRARINAGPHPT